MTKVFTDGANLDEARKVLGNSMVSGLTTNPSLMAKSGVTDYETFAREVLTLAKDKPVSIEVVADDLPGMERQARKIASWGDNSVVKIPVTTSSGLLTSDALTSLSSAGIKLNVTAVFTLDQVKRTCDDMANAVSGYISVFAGRIADTGVDPLKVVTPALEVMAHYPNLEMIWASSRQVFDYYLAESVGCHVITLTPDLIDKLTLKGKPLDQYSLETVEMFLKDARASRFDF